MRRPTAEPPPRRRAVPAARGPAALAALIGLAAAGGCAGMLQPGDALARLAGSAFAEERLVTHTCELLRVDDPERDLAGVAERASPAVFEHVAAEAEVLLEGAFGALGVGGACDAHAVIAARLAGKDPPEACGAALAQAFAPGARPFAAALRAELPGVYLSADGSAEPESLGRAVRGFLARPGYWAARLDLAPALVHAGALVAAEAEHLVDDLVASLPYVGGLVAPLARQATAEIVAYAFDGVVRSLASEALLGPASMARAACRLLASPRGIVAERLLRRTVLRFEPTEWRGQLAAPTPSPSEAPAATGGSAGYPMVETCRTLDAVVPAAAAAFGRQSPCEAAWSAVGDGSPWQPERLVPELGPVAPSAPGAAVAVRRDLERAAAHCGGLGGCRLDELVLRASFVALHGTAGASGAELRAALGPLLDDGRSLARHLDALAAELAAERRTREARDRELLGYLRRFGACDEVNRQARALRFAALVRQQEGGDLCAAPGLERACAEVDKLPKEPPRLREALGKEGGGVRAELERFCASAPALERRLWRSAPGKRSAELVVDGASLCALDATRLSLEARGALFDLGAAEVDAETRATLLELRRRFEALVRALDPSGSRDFEVAVVVDGRVSEEGAGAMPDQRALATERAKRVTAILGGAGPTEPGSLLRFDYRVGGDPDTRAVEAALRQGRGPCEAEGHVRGTEPFLRCVELHRGARLAAELPEAWYPCPRVEPPR
ncbi:MAG: hypothetical protein IT373_11050 [Polyangiaceae bacterium]|nr:hypothetical protein [Polyangiaceae bacterium]